MTAPVTQQGNRVLSTPLPASPESSALYLTSAAHHTGKHHPRSLPWMTQHNLPPSLSLALCKEGHLFTGFHTEGPGLGTQDSMQDSLSQGTPRVDWSHPQEVLILVDQDPKSFCVPSVRLPGCGSQSTICRPGETRTASEAKHSAGRVSAQPGLWSGHAVIWLNHPPLPVGASAPGEAAS